ncbi:MAG: serine/threonine-protein kinase [Candidatus Dormibacteria bacterium]
MPPQLRGYEFEELLGRGAMGAVHRGRQLALDRPVAIKQVLGAWSGDREALERFRREARALARMSHPNVVAVYDLEIADADLFLIMEYIAGPTLGDLSAAAPLNLGEALRALDDVGDAIAYAHSVGVVHRDLKPGNVFVSGSGSCKVGDFGLVKLLEAEISILTRPGMVMGSPSYMSPEQAQARPDVGPPADVYALAVMSYQFLVGRLPFEARGRDLLGLLEAHVSAPVPRPGDTVPDFPIGVEEVLLAGLSKDPATRPSAAQFRQRLDAAAKLAWPVAVLQADLATKVGAHAARRSVEAGVGAATLPARTGPVEAVEALPRVASIAPAIARRSSARRQGRRTSILYAVLGTALGAFAAWYLLFR